MKVRASVQLAILSFLTVILVLSSEKAYSQSYPTDYSPLVFTSQPSLPEPSYLTPIKDPTTGNVIMRITDNQPLALLLAF